MISHLTTRGALAATASIAAIGIGVMIWPSLRLWRRTRSPRSRRLSMPGPPTTRQGTSFHDGGRGRSPARPGGGTGGTRDGRGLASARPGFGRG